MNRRLASTFNILWEKVSQRGTGTNGSKMFKVFLPYLLYPLGSFCFTVLDAHTHAITYTSSIGRLTVSSFSLNVSYRFFIVLNPDFCRALTKKNMQLAVEVCQGLRALIVLDDVWIAKHLEPFAPLRGRPKSWQGNAVLPPFASEDFVLSKCRKIRWSYNMESHGVSIFSL